MRRILAIANRELNGYFNTVMGWLCLGGFIFLTGFIFAWIATQYADYATQAMMDPYGGGTVSVNEHLIPDFFGTTAVILLMLCPALSMRLFSEDIKQHSMELLLSAPLSSMEVVLGKFLGAMGFATIMLMCTLHYIVILGWISSPDPMIVVLNYVATLLLTGAFISAGMLASAFTRRQLLALMMSFGFLMVLWFLSGIGSIAGGSVGNALAYLSVLSHIEALSMGLLHLKDIIYFVTFIGLFLFATHQRVEAMRWQ